MTAPTCLACTEQLIYAGFEVEYIEEYNGRRYAAVTLAGVRLIDNVVLVESEVC